MPPRDEYDAAVPQGETAAELHPLLGKMTEAARMARETFEVLDPARTFKPASQLVESSWPRDLDSAQTTRLLELLYQITDAVAGCVEGIACKPAIPAQLKPRLEALCTELAGSTMQLHWLARDSQRTTVPSHATVGSSTTFPSRPHVQSAATSPGPGTGQGPAPTALITGRPPDPYEAGDLVEYRPTGETWTVRDYVPPGTPHGEIVTLDGDDGEGISTDPRNLRLITKWFERGSDPTDGWPEWPGVSLLGQHRAETRDPSATLGEESASPGLADQADFPGTNPLASAGSAAGRPARRPRATTPVTSAAAPRKRGR
jgi:hypothetical protein